HARGPRSRLPGPRRLHAPSPGRGTQTTRASGELTRAVNLRGDLPPREGGTVPVLAPAPPPAVSRRRESIRTQPDHSVKQIGLSGGPIGPTLRLAEAQIGEQRQQHQLRPQLL